MSGGFGCWAFLFLLPATVAAAETCPWLNAATAAGVLGSPVTMTVSHDTANRDDAVCSFKGNRSELRIAVYTSETPHSRFTFDAAECGSNPDRLKGLGNEAVACNHGANGQAALVVGRVRNRVFTVLVSADSSAVREKVRAVSEQVAGFLF